LATKVSFNLEILLLSKNELNREVSCMRWYLPLEWTWVSKEVRLWLDTCIVTQSLSKGLAEHLRNIWGLRVVV
jgi:hypothetical protein